MARVKVAPRMPKVIKRSDGKQQQLRRLLRGVAFLPLFYLLLERSILAPFTDSNLSSYLDVERVAVTNTVKKKEEMVAPKAISLEETRKSLESLTQPFRVTDASSVRCPAKGTGKTKIIAGYHHLGGSTALEAGTKASASNRRKIPKILHQQGISRCVSSALYDRNEELKAHLSTDTNGEEWSMYFHTEDAMTRLLRAVIAAQKEGGSSKHSIPSRIGMEFPHLGQILRNCVDNESFSKRLLWRFLCLYIYGGMYVDLEHAMVPTYDANAKTIIRDSYNTVLLWTTKADNTQQLHQPKKNIGHSEVEINPNVMAVSPGHPLIYYAVQHSLFHIISDGYLGEDGNKELNRSAQEFVVSSILKLALADFQERNSHSESMNNGKPSNGSWDESSRSMTYFGTAGDTTVTIIDASNLIEATGTTSGEDFFHVPQFLRAEKASPLGHGSEQFLGKSSSSCMRKLLRDVSTTT